MSDDRKSKEKSRMQSQQSTRLGHAVQNKSSKDDISYDLEVYDDRNFYSTLLKVWHAFSSYLLVEFKHIFIYAS